MENENNFEVRISNDSLNESSGKCKLYLCDFKQCKNIFEYDFGFSVDKNCQETVFSIEYAEIKKHFTKNTVLLCDLESDINNDRAFFIPDRFKDIDFDYNKVRIIDEDETSITITADEFTPFAMIDVPYYLEENCFPMKKGEVKKIKKSL